MRTILKNKHNDLLATAEYESELQNVTKAIIAISKNQLTVVETIAEKEYKKKYSEIRDIKGTPLVHIIENEKYFHILIDKQEKTIQLCYAKSCQAQVISEICKLFGVEKYLFPERFSLQFINQTPDLNLVHKKYAKFTKLEGVL